MHQYHGSVLSTTAVPCMPSDIYVIGAEHCLCTDDPGTVCAIMEYCICMLYLLSIRALYMRLGLRCSTLNMATMHSGFYFQYYISLLLYRIQLTDDLSSSAAFHRTEKFTSALNNSDCRGHFAIAIHRLIVLTNYVISYVISWVIIRFIYSKTS